MNELLKAFGLALSITEIEITLSQQQLFFPASSQLPGQYQLYNAQSFQKVIWKYTTQFGEQYLKYTNTQMNNQYNSLQSQYQQAIYQQNMANRPSFTYKGGQSGLYGSIGQQAAGQLTVPNPAAQAAIHQINSQMSQYSGITQLLIPSNSTLSIGNMPPGGLKVHTGEPITKPETKIDKLKSWTLKTFRIFKRSL